MITPVLLAIIFIYFTAHLYKRYQKIQLLELIPGPKALPIVGNALDFAGSHQHLFKMYCKICEFDGGIIRFYIGMEPYVLLYQAHTVEQLLSNNQLLQKSVDYKYFHPWLKTGLLTSSGEKWRSRRKLLTPSFHFKILEDFMAVFNKHSKKFVQKIEQLCDGEEHDIFHKVALCTLDVIMEAAMGNYSNLQDDSDNEYVKAVHGIGAIFHTRHVTPWIHPDILFKLFGYEKMQNDLLKILHGHSMKAIRKRREEFVLSKANGNNGLIDENDNTIGVKKRSAFLDLLIQNSEILSDEDIQEEVDTFMFGGHDTISSSASFALHRFASHPEIQERAFEEVTSIVDPTEDITMKHLSDMKYLEACIKESLRICPIVPLTGRQLVEETKIAGYRIPAGTNVVVQNIVLHKDPEQFPNPEKFDPERFLDADVASKRHPYSFLPFSAGARNCIGQKFALLEEKVILAHILRNFKMTTTQSVEDLKLVGELVVRAEDGIFVKFERRKYY